MNESVRTNELTQILNHNFLMSPLNLSFLNSVSLCTRFLQSQVLLSECVPILFAPPSPQYVNLESGWTREDVPWLLGWAPVPQTASCYGAARFQLFPVGVHFIWGCSGAFGGRSLFLANCAHLQLRNIGCCLQGVPGCGDELLSLHLHSQQRLP